MYVFNTLENARAGTTTRQLDDRYGGASTIIIRSLKDLTTKKIVQIRSQDRSLDSV